MALTTGKRKRGAVEPLSESRGSGSESDGELALDAEAVFRKHFEARFLPLSEGEVVGKVNEEAGLGDTEDDEEEGEESGWEGLSDDDEAGEKGIEIVEHTEVKPTRLMAKEELKKFMSSKVPTSISTTTANKTKAITLPDEDDESEAANLKKDLALQRLLAESHLLDSSNNHTVVGANRHKATDLRLQALGSKQSIFTQAKMPMSHRKGIIAKKAEKEEFRRREAKENGVILEKAVKKKVKSEGRRDRGVGGPNVGRFSGGTLTLSKRDIAEIEGPKKPAGGKGSKGKFMPRKRR